MEISGEVTYVRYYNDQSGWGVLVLSTDDPEYPSLPNEVTVVGAFQNPAIGQHLLVKGNFENHPKYGKNFKAQSYSIQPPKTVEGLQAYLAMTLPHVGPAIASKIVEAHGLETLQVLSSNPEALLDIPGITKARLESITKSWEVNHTTREIQIYLAQFGLSQAYIQRVIDRWGDKTVETVQKDPYVLVGIYGLGFLKVDKIALASGIPLNSPVRRRAIALYSLRQSSESGRGHVYLTKGQLSQAVKGMKVEGLDASTWSLEEQDIHLAHLENTNQVVVLGERVYLARLYHAERTSATKLAELLSGGTATDLLMPEVALDTFLSEYEQEMARRIPGFQFSEEQMQALRLANTSRVLIITGLPGTGKTTIMRAMVRMLEASGRSVALCAPTGRAAKRLETACGREAKTLHRLLGACEGGYWRVDHVGEAAVVVDEASMIDVELFYRLTSALSFGQFLVIVGDPAQLPSVGPGDVLRNLKASGEIPFFHLTQIHRQGLESDIVLNAHRVHNGESIQNRRKGDFNYIHKSSADEIKDMLFQVSERLAGSNVDFQILSPMRKNQLGSVALNGLLQPLFNPSPQGQAVVYYEKVFRVGDRVIVTKNNYDAGVMNGDIGMVISTNAREQAVTFSVEGLEDPVTYLMTDLASLELAYCMTIHKSQGSEWDVVVLLLHSSQYIMLTRNLLYTAMTRAKKKLIIIGNQEAVDTAIATNTVSSRNTSLIEFLKEALKVAA